MTAKKTTPISFALPVDWMGTLDALAEQTHNTKSEIIRIALGEYLNKPIYSTPSGDKLALKAAFIEDNQAIVSQMQDDERLAPITTTLPKDVAHKIDVIAGRTGKTKSEVARALIVRALKTKP